MSSPGLEQLAYIIQTAMVGPPTVGEPQTIAPRCLAAAKTIRALYRPVVEERDALSDHYAALLGWTRAWLELDLATRRNEARRGTA
jgi:hypothetical protein